MSDIKAHFRDKVMNHEVKVILKDKRVIYGRLTCIDKQRNLVIQECIMQTNSKYIAPVNNTLKFLISRDNYAQRFLGDGLFNKEFDVDKHYIGNIVVPGQQIHAFYVKQEKQLN